MRATGCEGVLRLVCTREPSRGEGCSRFERSFAERRVELTAQPCDGCSGFERSFGGKVISVFSRRSQQQIITEY